MGAARLNGKEVPTPFDVYEYPGDGAIAIRQGLHVLTKTGGASAMTVAQPTNEDIGKELVIVATTADLATRSQLSAASFLFGIGGPLVPSTASFDDGLGSPALGTLSLVAVPLPAFGVRWWVRAYTNVVFS